MTAATILTIAGCPEDHVYDRLMLLAADRRAARHVKQQGGALIGDGELHFDAFSSIATDVDRADVREAREALAKWDQMAIAAPETSQPWPSDAACNRWRPEVEAAYYFGLALGFRLAAPGAK